MTNQLKIQYMSNMTRVEREALLKKEKADDEIKELHKRQGCPEGYVFHLSAEQLKYQLNQLAHNDPDLDSLNWAGQKVGDKMILKLALSLKENTNCTTIDLKDCRMTADSAAVLAQTLSSKRIGRLTLSDNPLGDNGIQSVLDAAMKPDVMWYRIEAKNIGATKASLIRTSHVMHVNHHMWEVQFKENEFSPDDWMLYGQITEKFRLRRLNEIKYFQHRGSRVS